MRIPLPAKYRPSVVIFGTGAFAADMRFQGWTVPQELKLTGLRVQSLQCPQFFAASQPGFADGRFQNADRFIYDQTNVNAIKTFPCA